MKKWKISVIVTVILIMTLSFELPAEERRSNERTLDITSHIEQPVNKVLNENFYKGYLKKAELYLGKQCLSLDGELYVRNTPFTSGLLIEFEGKNCDKSCQFEELDFEIDRTSILWNLYPVNWIEDAVLLFVVDTEDILSRINTSVLELLGEYCK
jgi:hypothetical protein